MQTLLNEPQSLLFHPGDELPQRTNHLWLIINGVVKSYTVSEEGTSITLGFWGVEDLVGESLSKVFPHTLKCMSEVEAIAIDRAEWATVSRNLLYHAQQTQQLMYILRSTRIAKRLWLLLEWMAGKFGREIRQGKLIDFKLTHQELADVVGTTRITVTKTLNQFEREGLIIRPKTKCIILRRC